MVRILKAYYEISLYGEQNFCVIFWEQSVQSRQHFFLIQIKIILKPKVEFFSQLEKIGNGRLKGRLKIRINNLK